MSELQGWADLPEVLLHSIFPLLISFRDLLAFAATCPSWRAAFSSYPSKSTLFTLFPPLLLQPSPRNVEALYPKPLESLTPASSSSRFPLNLRKLFRFHSKPHVSEIPESPRNLLVNFRNSLEAQIFPGSFNDVASPNSIPRNFPKHENGTSSSTSSFFFIGATFGHLIVSSNESCLLVDAFTGGKLSSPPLPHNKHTDPNLNYGALTAPPASPNSHLVVSTDSCTFWRVGSGSWSKPRRSRRKSTIIKHIAAFKGEVFGMDSYHKLFRVHLSPAIRIEEIQLDWREGRGRPVACWLVACGDMLLMVVHAEYLWAPGHFHDSFEAYRVDMSAVPAKMVKVERLENRAIFISSDERSQALSCINPERWGGRSSRVYYSTGRPWDAYEMGENLPTDVQVCRQHFLQLTWAVPSVFSLFAP